MVHTKFCGNRPAGSREEGFRRFFYHIWVGGHLGHVISISISLYLKAFIQNLILICTVVSEKIQFNFCMYTTLVLDQEMTLTFNTHIS